MDADVTKTNKRKNRQDVARVYDEYAGGRDESPDGLDEYIDRMLREGFTI
jgi:hypothetical protein